MAALMRSWRKSVWLGTECILCSVTTRSDACISRHRRSLSSTNLNIPYERGLFENVFPDTRLPELTNLLSSPQSMYCGYDPTADSLHIGNLLSLIALLHGQRAGHNPIAVIGGATALIGDPSGKTKEREAMRAEDVENNVIAIMKNVGQVVNNHRDFIYKGEKPLPQFRILNNYDWYRDKDVITFLSTTGRHFRLGEMISKHSVQSRLNSKEGMSCTEFMYQVFQSNDWLHLCKEYNCTLQIGGADQMGNISSGFNLVHRVTQKYAFGLLVPLILSPSGEKLGKTAGNSMWLDPSKTSPYELYQYFFNMPDSVVERYLKLFTFLSLEEIEAVMEEQSRSPDKRPGQTTLAEQMTLLVHGESGVDIARKCTSVLFGNSLDALSDMNRDELLQLFKNTPTTELTSDPQLTLMDLCRKLNCFSRDADADRIIKAGGVYINQQRVTEPGHKLSDGKHILENSITVVRIGKKNYHLVKWL